MSKTDEVRITKLRELLEELKRGKPVQNRQLRTWLGDEGYKVYEDNWSNAVDLRNVLTSKPSAIVDYENLLRKAILLYNRGQAVSGKSARQLHAKAQAAFEKTLMHLEDEMGADPSLAMWLDRHCDFSASGELSLDPVGMPRVITSRSRDNLSGGIAAKTDSKRQSKIRAIEAEIERLANPVEHLSDEHIAEKLRKLKFGWNR